MLSSLVLLMLFGAVAQARVMVAENERGAVVRGDQQFTTPGAAAILEQAPLEVEPTSAALSARFNDFGLESTYYFEYGTSSAYGSATQHIVAPGEETTGQITSTSSAVTGLQPSTQYHFRLVVENSLGTVHGEDATFTTVAPTSTPVSLPDARGYEKVSPAANADGDVYQDLPGLLDPETPAGTGANGAPTEEPFVVAADGSAVAYPGDPSEKGGVGHEGNDAGNEYVARRVTNGNWTAANVDPPSTNFADQPVYQSFTPDLSSGVLTSNGELPLAPGAPSGRYSVLYKRDFDSGSYESLLPVTPPNRTYGEFGAYGLPHSEALGVELAYAGGSADLTHSLFMANDALTSNARDGGSEANNLYDSHGGALTLVNVLPNGTPESEPNATFGGPAVEPPSPLFGEPGQEIPAFAHDISTDGSRIFWTDLNTHDLYVRENDAAPQSPISEAGCTVPGDACTLLIAEEAQFWNATPDGSKVLYSKGGDLYEYDLETGQSTDLAAGAELQGVVGASEDLAYVYFVGDGALAPGAEAKHCVRESQEEEDGRAPRTSGCNLYALHVGGSPRYIGALSSDDDSGSPESFYREYGDWSAGLGDKEAEATPDGSHLLFVSRESLTGHATNRTEQVYLYDFPDGQLACASCAADGEQAGRKHRFGRHFDLSAFLPPSHMNTYLPHWMSDDGDRIFFDTLDSLVPQDTNGTTDVYEWERTGSGSCAESPGCIYPISDGTSVEGSFLIGTTASGDDAFFTTRDKLLGEDENENVDIYDARVGVSRPPAAPQCSGSGCQGVPSAPPVFATPASSTFNGVGNFETAVTQAKLKPKPLTRAQKLAKALKACHGKPKKKRAACEAQARKRYGAKRKSKSSRSARGKHTSKGSK